jgi:hypothetical protein
MHTNIEISNNINDCLPVIKFLIAESDLFEIDRIKANINREFQTKVKFVKTYLELLTSVTEENPQLLILGKIDKFNYFETCKECHKINESLPIFLLSRQQIINDSFLSLAKTRGLTDIINLDCVKLNQLFETISKLSTQQSIDRTLGSATNGRMMLTILAEIIMIANNYFGPLAQGNYWRKAHNSIVNEFPSLLNWSADHFSKISCEDRILDQELTAEDIHSIRIWVEIFIGECERIIVGFGAILNNSNLSPLTKEFLDKS